jgi:hypothetical protein
MGFCRSPQGYPVGRQPRKGTHFVSGSSRPWSRVLRGVTVQVYFRKPGARPGFMCVNFGGFFLANKTRRIWFHRVGPFLAIPVHGMIRRGVLQGFSCAERACVFPLMNILPSQVTIYPLTTSFGMQIKMTGCCKSCSIKKGGGDRARTGKPCRFPLSLKKGGDRCFPGFNRCPCRLISYRECRLPSHLRP